MRSFLCPSCGQPVFFDDDTCLACGTAIGYRPEIDDVVVADGQVRCDGHARYGCPWLLADGVGWCVSCRLDVDDPDAPLGEEREVFERCKRRVVRQLLQAGLDLHAVPQLRFQLRSSEREGNVTIGHAEGLVTLDLAEADPVTVEQVRTELDEAYRTPLGHIRHETGHWHWEAWVATVPSRHARFRELFGDETEDYAAALDTHYATGDDGSWRGRFVTFYASTHPWEDYAESFAHVLHLRDTLETAVWHGLVDADMTGSFQHVYRAWQRLTVTMNDLARSMGVADLYPFAPPTPAIEKLHFVHDVLLARDGA